MTPYVGRSREVAEVRHALATARLLTLTGVGGVGKTRLALEVAAASSEYFTDGAWVVDLAPVRVPSAVADAVATALGVLDLGTRPVPEQLAGYLAGRHTLIVLDNCEHLVDACAELAKTLLSAAAGLRMVATSRQMLGMTGEHVFTVPPLAPDEAVELLEARTSAVRPDFRVTEANQAQVRRLCADLDGLPLAIELAAARLRTLTVGQAADRLADRFALLTSGCRIAPPRQRTLRALVDWSWELCTPAERLLWNRLSVFAGTFALDAAEEVCAGEGVSACEVLDLLDRLVAQSVVLTCEVEGQPRYRLLETIRQYGRERLADSGEEERLLLRHRDFFLALAQHVDTGWYGPGQVENLARLRAEHGNLLAALDCGADPQVRLALAAALAFHWCVGGFLGEGRRQLDRALAVAPEPSPARARALISAVWVALCQGDLAVADQWLDEADAVGEQLGDPAVRADVTGFRGVSAHYRGQVGDAMTRYEDALAALTALGDERGAAGWLLALACLQAYVGDPRAAETGWHLITAAEATGERWGRAQVLLALGFDAWQRGDREETRGRAQAALESMRGFNDHSAVARMLEVLAWATACAGDREQAARLLGAADTLWRDAGTAITAFDPRMAEHHARCEAEVIDALGQAAYERAFTEGGLHGSPDRAIAFALELPTYAATGTGPAAPEPDIAPSPLTRREREVAALVAKGMSNRQIGTALGRSPRTIDGHVENILAKLGFASRARIASWWTTNQAPTP
ncbi:LuxR C-terminal-related transcriptional regulator [Streptomyces sp. SP18BB07]|uniref:LuxR C-terminal-related transcriptional regulator n=1 Tax=Streptomyces sp. SP18BB07 TaxID=3002522 RepID=UPI002E7A2D0D|nr:LuxR C-terminal-related transcriptional regulator [Streptomyces sp. SP18BB07]